MTNTSFQKDGYAVFDDALSADELTMLQTTCDKLLEEPPEDGGEGRHTIGLGHARRFLAHRHGDFPDLQAFVLGKTLGRIARECLGDDTLLFNEQFVVKGAGKGASFAWHQDSAYVGYDHAPYVTVWMALDDTTEENGCVYIIPRDLEAEPGIDPHEWQDDTNELNGYFGEDPGRPMVCKAGTVVAFSSRTLHRSGPNTTGKPRRAYIAQYSVGAIRDPETGELKRFATPVAA
ncbi:MAG: phytanoyl-CoA dioxygenase family protein [Paracoccaceae bacterium]|nr:phytanoyl-CoA dioxygenase family protein [Paracoccaceae bacterium]